MGILSNRNAFGACLSLCCDGSPRCLSYGRKGFGVRPLRGLGTTRTVPIQEQTRFYTRPTRP